MLTDIRKGQRCCRKEDGTKICKWGPTRIKQKKGGKKKQTGKYSGVSFVRVFIGSDDRKINTVTGSKKETCLVNILFVILTW